MQNLFHHAADNNSAGINLVLSSDLNLIVIHKRRHLDESTPSCGTFWLQNFPRNCFRDCSCVSTCVQRLHLCLQQWEEFGGQLVNFHCSSEKLPESRWLILMSPSKCFCLKLWERAGTHLEIHTPCCHSLQLLTDSQHLRLLKDICQQPLTHLQDTPVICS